MIRKHLKGYGHEVWTELGDCPHNRQALQFSGWVRLLSLVQSPRSTADDALLALPNLSQDSTEACCGGVGVQPECLAEIRESSDWAGSEPGLQLVKCCLAVLAPVEERIFSGQSVQGCGNSGKTLDIPAVIKRQDQEKSALLWLSSGVECP